MKAQRKTTRPRISGPKISGPKISGKDRELEQLLRRAALYLKNQAAAELHAAPKKRVAAA